MGFGTKQVKVAKSNVINVVLEEAVTLNEVVMVSQGYSRKKSMTTSQTTKSYSKSLQGNTPGLQISHSSGNPGSSKFLIRGSSVTSNTPPDSLMSVIEDLEDNVSISQLTVDQQIPLFMATVCGRSAYLYWSNQIQDTSSATWGDYLSLVQYLHLK